MQSVLLSSAIALETFGSCIANLRIDLLGAMQ
jgi:hypothetical protein